MTKEWQAQFYALVGKYLKGERERRGLEIADLARESNQQYHTIERIEDGKGFQFHNVVWIMNTLGVSIDKLIGDLAVLTTGRFVSASIEELNVKAIKHTGRKARGHEDQESSTAEDLV